MTGLLRRRTVLMTGGALCGAALAGCSVLPARPYQERRQWPLDIPPPPSGTARGPAGKVLLLRAVRAGPGMDTRGLRTILADGAERIANWEEWSVPPPQGVEDDLRQWLASSGIFAAVVMPGSAVKADFVLEGELLALAANPQTGTARAAIAITLLREPGSRPVLQRSFAGSARLQGQDGPALAGAMRAAIADMLASVQAALAAHV